MESDSLSTNECIKIPSRHTFYAHKYLYNGGFDGSLAKCELVENNLYSLIFAQIAIDQVRTEISTRGLQEHRMSTISCSSASLKQ